MHAVSHAAWHTVLLRDAPSQPWRNGGGVTQELLAWPTAHGWQLRVSVAQITQDGPFSAFPGVERWFSVLSGAGVRLVLDGESLCLTPQSAPLHFDGAAAPACTLIDGPTHDLNLMGRHEAGRTELLAAAQGVAWHSSAAWRGLFCSGAALMQPGAHKAAVRLNDAGLLWTDAAAPDAWHLLTLAPGARAWWLQFEAHRA